MKDSTFPSMFSPGARRTLSPSNLKARSQARAGLWLPSKSMPHLPSAPRPASSLPPCSGKEPSAQAHSSAPGNICPCNREGKAEPEKKDPEKKVASEPPIKGRAPLVKVEEVTVEEGTAAKPPDPAAPASALSPTPAPSPALDTAPSSTVSASVDPKTSAGTTDPEEARRLLAEKRRLAREQREKKERERKDKEELERQKIEELSGRVAEEGSHQEEEACRLEAEQEPEKEELVLLLAEEEREQLEREEVERLQKQKRKPKSGRRQRGICRNGRSISRKKSRCACRGRM
ncbi:ensconsin-like [Apodemus sylvaticus]|uniref:ensconsin-like n=1 Tax=Apodemus sylvaticus TaxID=10129 RepID=UPI0022437691|nr:ensconsin-like [Apodemus sylvaticus]